MSWFIRGESYACCSCSVGCPCAVGEMQTAGSVGCAAVQIMDIEAGEIDGTDVSGTKIAAVVDWPGPMMAGNGTGRLYFDVDTSPEQRAALEALISGKLGGGFSRIPELVTATLSSLLAPIRKETTADGTLITVGDFGQARVKPMRTPSGDGIGIHGSGGFRDDVMLAVGHGSWWRDPQLRQWEGGGYAEQSEFEWRW
jgi:hypothetical protein